MRAERYVVPGTIQAKSDEWLGHIRGIVRPRSDLILKPEKCALLIIDMVRYFAHPGGRGYLPASDAVTPRIAALLHLWRSLGGLVIFTRHCHMNADDLGMLGKFYTDHINCDERDSHLIGELSPLKDERVFRKDTYDSFYGTGLEEYLRASGIEQVLVTGVLTQLCCETAARSAFVRGFEVYLAADAMATTTEELHLGSLLGLASGFAVIGDTAEILEKNSGRQDI